MSKLVVVRDIGGTRLKRHRCKFFATAAAVGPWFFGDATVYVPRTFGCTMRSRDKGCTVCSARTGKENVLPRSLLRRQEENWYARGSKTQPRAPSSRNESLPQDCCGIGSKTRRRSGPRNDRAGAPGWRRLPRPRVRTSSSPHRPPKSVRDQVRRMPGAMLPSLRLTRMLARSPAQYPARRQQANIG